jgi:hypothetical protein
MHVVPPIRTEMEGDSFDLTGRASSNVKVTVWDVHAVMMTAFSQKVLAQ